MKSFGSRLLFERLRDFCVASEARSQPPEARIFDAALRPTASNELPFCFHPGNVKTDKARFMNIAEGSLEGSRYYLILASDLGCGKPMLSNELGGEVSRRLNAYERILASGS